MKKQQRVFSAIEPKPRRRRRRLLFLSLAVLALASGMAVMLYACTRSRTLPIEQALYDHIRLGMTEQEVDAAIPYPPGNHSGAFAYGTNGPIREGELSMALSWDENPAGTVSGTHPTTCRPVRGKAWRGSAGWLVVFFGDDNRVIERRYYGGFPESFLQYQARHWLGW